ncbi:hypothetical protein PFISCL1PPCAC_4410 [Pristionchus fissidentatus]|uniref:C2H2-type domain-containing protein n=1 Tax=Pristionchus fissidentatus TaxID=1538716 RepID=A0AAV5V261_9BILA|nr:hypothetical protein PFISCL1PPCAC_4410 [Pristionchus fissidentatus]
MEFGEGRSYVMCKDMVCDYRTNDVKALNEHEKLPHSVTLENARFPPKTRCPYCKTNVWNLMQFKAHMQDRHITVLHFNSQTPALICSSCGFMSARVHEMVQHWNEKTGRCELGMEFDYEAADRILKEMPIPIPKRPYSRRLPLHSLHLQQQLLQQQNQLHFLEYQTKLEREMRPVVKPLVPKQKQTPSFSLFLHCQFCPFKTLIAEDLAAHEKNFHRLEFDRKLLPCSSCDFCAIDTSEAADHFNGFHCVPCDERVPICQQSNHVGCATKSFRENN